MESKFKKGDKVYLANDCVAQYIVIAVRDNSVSYVYDIQRVTNSRDFVQDVLEYQLSPVK